MGESPFDVAVRIKVFLGTLKRDCENHKIDTVFIFTYGVTLRTFVMQYLHFQLVGMKMKAIQKIVGFVA